MNPRITKRKVCTFIFVGAIIIAIIIIIVSSQSFQRWIKDIKSDYTGGINRTVTVYDYDGNKIESYSGKFDVQYKSDGTVKFDIDGKRTIITGGIIINQEE